MLLGSLYVNVGSPRQLIGVTDRRTDRQMDRFLAKFHHSLKKQASQQLYGPYTTDLSEHYICM